MTTAPRDLVLDDFRELVCKQAWRSTLFELECLDELEHELDEHERDRGVSDERWLKSEIRPGDDRNTMSHDRAEMLLRRCLAANYSKLRALSSSMTTVPRGW